MMLSLKRTREEAAVVEAAAPVYSTSWPAGRSFQCKTCNKEFPSFQALGGHRASHNKPNKLVGVDGVPMKAVPSTPAKPKRHNCSICGTEFPMGQALGGHMRKHQEKHTNTKNNTKNDQRNAKKMVTMTNSTCSTTTTTTSSTVSEAGGEPEQVQRVIKRPRVVIFGVDLSMVETEKEKDGRDSPALLDLLQ